MTIDALEQVGLVAREVRTGERGGRPTKVAEARRTYRAEVEDVWDALTSAERLPRWFLPVSGDLRVGGRYQLEGNAGGTVEACERPGRLAVTWEYNGEVSWVEVHLAPAGDGTELRLVHEAHVDPAFWEQFGPGAVGVGWDLALWGLATHLATRAAVDPAAAEAWTVGPEGRAFVTTAATGWADAAAADGDDPAAAREAGARTIAFYTGQEAPTGDAAAPADGDEQTR
ncbi:SRPBCC family protein [Cellulomonas fimi]|uniref:Activator of Hsp90 ATPase 1 family protein n=1 Tax=Cellulomonas fimi (strain ATCC 484 / DSM 20113 / JCM 1341 / CCUG 24087 / LMG 16345 / NBRC 15513 / NCIMB 8980 / NCTC 7547 / NRS-133) TaxID=590998 RepID=F4H7I0_CELFA|nr:SRPBCC family protein [Cellulomonas fimi]AEE44537.1 Activator of Hsp90 ATPase 1 family protein [Cellulomonas fimi ATCC 484]NNH06487.1 SRPBCC family protein [Cellulomonas fimi]VEH26564.1 Activator of Hsp90 ATPase homolog 1-like protein [Cellulomonas fimi]